MKKHDTEILEIEQNFHDKYAETLDWDKAIGEFMSYESDRISPVEQYFKEIIGDVKGKRILDVGSGHGNCALRLAKMGGSVSSIDISQKIIEGCRHRAAKNNVSVDFHVMDACTLEFNGDEFDLVVGFRTIHHLPDVGRFYMEARRVLKKKGRLILVEPQKYNPFVEFGRKFIKPHDRTQTEHPLVPSDIRLAKKIFGNLETHEFEFLSVVSLFFKQVVNIPALYNIFLKILIPTDNILSMVPFLKPLYWQIVLICIKE